MALIAPVASARPLPCGICMHNHGLLLLLNLACTKAVSSAVPGTYIKVFMPKTHGLRREKV